MRLLISCLLTVACFGYSSKDLTLEEKIGQLLIVHFHGEAANDDAKTLVNDVHAGGFIYYNWANGLTSPDQVKALSSGLQHLARDTRLAIPLFIAVDQEGGVVARLNQGFTIFPGNKALGMTGKPQLAEEAALMIGHELQSVGVNFNFAPVVDVNSNPRNPVIGVRSFGESPELVAIFGEKTLHGYRKAGIITCLKHFPGHGDVEIDSHEDLPMIRKSLEMLTEVELYPFAQLAAEADTVMTAHLLVPALDPDHCSTLSKKTLDYLRGLGFKGAIVSDSLVMEGVLKKTGSVDEAAIQALNAGCDILILGGKQLVGSSQFELTTADVQRIHGALVKAVKSGRVSEERVNQAVDQVLELKFRYLLTAVPRPMPLPQKIAALALRVIKPSTTSLAEKKVVVIAPSVLKDALPKTHTTFFFEGLNSPVDLKQAESADAIIFCSYNAWKNPNQAAAIDALIKTGNPVIVVAVRDPLDAELFPQAEGIIATYSPTAPALEAAFHKVSNF